MYSWLRLAVFFIGLGMLAATQGARAETPLEAAMSFSLPSNLVASPMKNRVAWVENVRGRRNVWVAEAGAERATARQVTHYTKDDGYDLGNLAWATDGDTILFVRGSTLDIGSQAENPVTNPASRPEGGPPWEIWSVNVAGRHEPQRFAEGRGPAVSSRGHLVAFLHDGQVWIGKLDGKTKPRQLIHDQGDSKGHAFSQPPRLEWSPDGNRLAFVSQRGDHNFIGVYDTASDSINWMAPSTDVDSNPRWSRDSRKIAFVRASGGAIPFSKAPMPWSIWVADVRTGAGLAVWSAQEGAGDEFTAPASIADKGALLWDATDHIIFPWEKTGWLQLYRVSAEGGEARPLTAGEFEILDAVLTPAGNQLVYSANAGDLDRRHIWKVPTEGGTAQALTKGQGTEDRPVVSSNGAVAMVFSDGVTPPRVGLVSSSGVIRPLNPHAIPKNSPAVPPNAPKVVIIKTADGLVLHGQLFLPATVQGKRKNPALLYFHGGPSAQALPAWPVGGDASHNYAYCLYLASRGFVVLSVNYRGSTGYGAKFRQPENFSANGASEVRDIEASALYLRSRAEVDPKRVGIWGHSYGGVMTGLGLSRLPHLFAAGVDWAGVHNWRSILIKVGFISSSDSRGERMFASSPIAEVKNWRAPTLVIHSEDDRNIPFSQVVELVTALRKNKTDFELFIQPNEIHEPLMHQSWLSIYQRMDAFFDRRLSLSEQTAR